MAVIVRERIVPVRVTECSKAFKVDVCSLPVCVKLYRVEISVKVSSVAVSVTVCSVAVSVQQPECNCCENVCNVEWLFDRI